MDTFFISFAGVILLFALIIKTAAVFSRIGLQIPDTKPPDNPAVFGKGEPITYVVMGDSTSAGRGGDYSKGMAHATAEFLATDRKVSLYNFSVSGAKFTDVMSVQYPKVKMLSPDIVLVSAGANDVIALTKLKDLENTLNKSINNLYSINRELKIFLTGAPDVGSVPRIKQPLRWLAGLRSRQINRMIDRLAQRKNVFRIPIYEETGPIFRANPDLFAADRFHPNTKGYEVWNKVIIKALKKNL